MILLVTPCERVAECVKALKENTGEEVVLADSLHRAATLLRTEAYRAVVFDQQILEAEPDEVETTMEHLGIAIPVQINFAISGIERVVREVRAALRRRTREQAAARQAATGILRSELNGTITALLLQCEMARETPGIAAAAAEKIQTAYNLVQKLRAQIESGSHEMSR